MAVDYSCENYAGDGKKVIVHACCAVCLGYPHELLTELGYDISVFYYNPNIYPFEEYARRRDEVIRFCADKGTELKIVEEPSDVFYSFVSGLEKEPERGGRCEKCFQLRLEKTAEYASSVGAEYFTTTLSVSPHKRFSQIKAAAEIAAEKYGVKYLEMDFKKKNGFLRTNEIARSYNFYRQTYCGCEFSVRGK